MTKIFGRRSYILMFCVVIVLGLMVTLFTMLQTDINEKQTKLNNLYVQLADINSDNEEIERLINEADEAELYEHLARERGYVYPDEKIYYDVTPGN